MKTAKFFSFIALAVALCVALSVPAKAQKTARRAAKTARTEPLRKAEIKEAEERLSELGYWTGAVDGVFDNASRFALIAFQKVEGREPTGKLTRDELEALRNAKAPQPRDGAYRHVEVDLEKQVLYVVDDDGCVARILPVSTGSGKEYKAKGMSGTAYTPRGRFRIYSKVAGWRTSPLGLLYYPNYISDGIAIHGNPSVPSNPASHGCIRIPMYAAAPFSRMVSVGSIVLIYDERSFVSAKDWAREDQTRETRASAQ